MPMEPLGDPASRSLSGAEAMVYGAQPRFVSPGSYWIASPVGARPRTGVGSCAAKPRAMRVGKSAESSTIQLTEEDYLVAIRPLRRGDAPLVDPGGTTARLLEERT